MFKKRIIAILVIILSTIAVITLVIKFSFLKNLSETYCSSSKSFGECIEKGCIFADVAKSSDPEIRKLPFCRPPGKK